MAQATPAPSARYPLHLAWPTLLFSLLAMAALCAREGSLLSPLPPLALAMLGSQFSRLRMEHAAQVWMVRVPLFIVVTIVGMSRPFPDAGGLYDPRSVCLAGELLATEMTLQAWRRHPSGGGSGVGMILLSGLIMLAAADSTEDRAIWFFTPAYTLCLALAVPGFLAPPQDRAESFYRRSPGAWAALAFALVLGAAMHASFRAHQEELTEWGMQMLHEAARSDILSSSLSTAPSLGASYGLQGSDERAYRIEGARGADLPDHLRVMAFDTYLHRNWLPGENSRTLRIDAARNLPPAHPPVWRVTRLIANNGLIAAPLETSGFDPLDQRNVRWAGEMGPLKSDSTAPSAYLITVGRPRSQGPFCARPDGPERARLLTTPPEMDPRVRDLAMTVQGGASTPEAKAAAVASYLPAHHRYSLSYRPGPGDPVSRFLLSDSAAHCEYFASSAVLLLRCLGIPARYVIGYYAHERDGFGRIVVRQRDAHAWAEAWIDGTGWITLDATPADGRPDRFGGAPWWTRFTEWVGDCIADLRARLGRFGVPAVFIAAVVVGLAIAWRNWPRQSAKRTDRAEAYTMPSEEMMALATRFEQFCAQRGRAFPPNTTWGESLNPSQVSSETPAAPYDLEAARAFVLAYSAVRWGGGSPRNAAYLKELLEAVENTAIDGKSAGRREGGGVP